jgi:pimeloyl-ACP methyl ester carboxylesterase
MKVKANGVELEYESFGREGDPVVLLVMGLGAQLTLWPDALCEKLTVKGFRVIRYDNRDVGLSTKFDAAGLPDMAQIFAGAAKPAYTLDDMAADAVGLLDALKIEKAHIVGASMGGMIAQLIAANHPEKTLSLTSIMSTTGNPAVPPATPEAMAALTTRLPPDAPMEAMIDNAVKTLGGHRQPGARLRHPRRTRPRPPVSAALDLSGRIRPPNGGHCGQWRPARETERRPGPHHRDPRRGRSPGEPARRQGYRLQHQGR